MAYMKKYMLIVAALAMLVSGCCNKDASTGSASNCSNENTKEETTMNTTMQDLLTRRSIRSYTDQVPPREVIEEICEAGTYAPTGMGRQSPLIAAVQNPADYAELERLNGWVMGQENGHPFYGAPTIVLVFGSDPAEWANSVPDGSLVLGNMMLAAHAVGLGSCWINREREMFATPEGKALMRELGLPDGLIGIGALALGYPASFPPTVKPRKENYYRIIK